MDTKSLRCFLAVAEKLNFSRAAESLYLSQPALSLRINALEDELGVQLFQRTRQRVYLTAAGSALLPEVQEIIARLDTLPEVAQNCNDYRVLKTGKLAFALDSTLPESMLGALTEGFEDFYAKYPEVSVSINSVEFDQYETALFSRKIDLCLIGLKESEIVNPSLNLFPIAKEPMVLALRGGEFLTNEQVLEQREILLLEGEDRWNLVLMNYLFSQQLHPKVRTIKGGPALCVNLMQKKTVTFMPKSFFDSLGAEEFECREMNIPDAQVISCLVWGKENYNPALQLIINCFDSDGKIH